MKDKEIADKRIVALAERVHNGDVAALARALTLAENGNEALMQKLRRGTKNAAIIGFTGPPGSGKSTLVNALIRVWRNKGQRVAVLAVDPVSPLSGGAVLGDRTRMGEHSLDAGVFIRSVSARGHLGGLSQAAQDMIDVMDTAGWDLILLETVGAGQSETEVAAFADVTIVISAPGLGDDVQAIKAGILEIADILVVNKADRPEAEQTAKQLTSMLTLRTGNQSQSVPVLSTIATTGDGVEVLQNAIVEQTITSMEERKRRHDHRMRLVLADRLSRYIRDKVLTDQALEDLLQAINEGDVSMDDAIHLALDQITP